MRGLPLKFMKSYLSDRTQDVKIKGSTSKHAPISCGVPQGSVLGSLFTLTIYINQNLKLLSVYLRTTQASLFVDKKIRRLEAKVNTSLENIINWLKADKLTLNIGKSRLLFFDLPPSTNKTYALNIQVNCHKLEQSKSVRYLKVVFDNKLHS